MPNAQMEKNPIANQKSELASDIAYLPELGGDQQNRCLRNRSIGFLILSLWIRLALPKEFIIKQLTEDEAKDTFVPV